MAMQQPARRPQLLQAGIGALRGGVRMLVIGATASADLQGVMTGFGLVFVTVGAGGNFNFDSIAITGTGVGGINASPLIGGNFNLTWVGNPAVNMESTTNLANPVWLTVPNTLGAYSLPVSTTVRPQEYFRLKGVQ